MRLLPLALAVAALGSIPAAAHAQAAPLGDATAGAEVFSRCAGCHEIGAGAENRIGPHLNMLFGRPAAGLDGFPYSRSLRRAGVNGLVWHADTLSAFLENPRAVASGTRMSFPGMPDAQERADLIAYLRRFSADPANIPEADPTARASDHSVDPAILAIRGDPEYGAYLSAECTTCHQIDGGDEGIPSIVFWPEADFVTALHAYRDGVREHPVMQMIASRLSNEEIAALAAYFAKPER